MKIWQRNAVVAVVVLFVAVSVYLSWSYNNEVENNRDVPVHNPGNHDVIADVVTDPGDGEITQATTLSPERQAYFAEARLTRQQARDSALTLLNDAAALPAATQESRDEAAAAIIQIAEHAMVEATIEGLVRAQGFVDVVAFISDSRLTLVVAAPDNGLTAVDVARIQNVLQNETPYSLEQISIFEA